MTAALRIAIVGAESTGKSVLAGALAAALGGEFGLHCLCVDEYLREWCDEHGRTPRRDEQAALAREHQRRIDAAAARPDLDLLLCDTTPLMVAVYSDLLFDDRTLYPFARAGLARMDATLLTSLDLPWVADGLQRDGPQVREPVDGLLRELLIAHRLPWALVGGSGPARAANALDALAPLLRRQATPRRGLFTRLAERNADDRPWTCELCDDPACEHLSRRQREETRR